MFYPALKVMSEETHLFISDQNSLLPHWKEAFPTALCQTFEVANAHVVPSMLWVRLRQSENIGEQLLAAQARQPGVPLVALSDIPGDQEGREAFAAGARGYCNAHAQPAVLRQVAAVVLQGGMWIGEDFMQRLIAVANTVPATEFKAPAALDWESKLTDREQQVALEVARGASNKEIAKRLGITERTVKMHLGAVFAKLEVRDRLQLSLLVRL